MTENEFNTLWETEKPIYGSWGSYVVSNICEELEKEGKNLDNFLKIPTKYRLKENQSLIDKAFYRPDKSYSEPYEEIEDKVGARFIVLFIKDLELICNIIENFPNWVFEVCKDFGKDKEIDPLLFTYQSIHYVLRPKEEIEYNGIKIPVNTPCEVQLRTLLQHAHAELTHDAIYKSKRKIQPEVHRTAAKSMALIETTDDFFTLATKQLNYEAFDEFKIKERLDSLYFNFTGLKPYFQKSSFVLWDEFEDFVNEDLVQSIQDLINGNTYLIERMKHHYSVSVFYQQSSIMFIYWLLNKRRIALIDGWPFKKELLLPLADDLGVSTWEE